MAFVDPVVDSVVACEVQGLGYLGFSNYIAYNPT